MAAPWPAEVNIDVSGVRRLDTNSGMAEALFAGTHNATGQAVVIKIQPAANGIHEAAVLQRLHTAGPHPNIIGYFDHVVHRGRSYLVLENAMGGEWFDKLMNGVMTEDEVRPIFRQSLAAVRFMHSVGVGHRDLKLENVMLRADGSVAMIDFGLCHMVPEPVGGGTWAARAQAGGVAWPQLNQAVGSKSYMPPQMYALSNAYDARQADAWSLGICLATCLAGFFPFDKARQTDWRFLQVQRVQEAGGSTARELFAMYNRPCPLTDEAVSLIDGLLTIDPAARMTLDAAAECPWAARGAPSPALVLPAPPRPEPDTTAPAPEPPPSESAGAQVALEQAREAGYGSLQVSSATSIIDPSRHLFHPHRCHLIFALLHPSRIPARATGLGDGQRAVAPRCGGG